MKYLVKVRPIINVYLFYKEEEEELDERITYENIEDKERYLEILQDTFGSNEQPSLDKLEYKVYWVLYVRYNLKLRK